MSTRPSWYLTVLLVACSGAETHIAPPPAATQDEVAAPSPSGPPGAIAVPPRSLSELREQAQGVRDAFRARVDANEDSTWVDDEADGFQLSGRRVFVYEDEAQSEPGFGTSCRAFSARTDEGTLTLVVDTERDGACISTDEWQLTTGVFVSGGYRGRCDGMALMGDGRRLAYSRVAADASHVLYASGAMGHGLACFSAVRDIECPGGGEAHCVVQEPDSQLVPRDPNSSAGRQSVAAPPENDCLVECAPNPCEEALGDDRRIGATYSRSSSMLAVFNRRQDCLTYARGQAALRAEEAEEAEPDELQGDAECGECAAAASAPTERVRELSAVSLRFRPGNSETSRWVAFQRRTRESQPDGGPTVLDVRRCIERLVNDQPRGEDGGVRFAATYVAQGSADGGYALLDVSAPHDVIGDTTLAERGRDCFPPSGDSEDPETTPLTFRFSTERE